MSRGGCSHSARSGVGAIKLLYIAGYGRSGSTVLGALLGSDTRLLNLGEVAFLPEDWSAPSRPCSCGSCYTICDFWKGALGDSEAVDLARVSRRVERFRAFGPLALGVFRRRTFEAYRTGQRRLLEHALRRSEASVVVDCSKSAWATAWRALALKKLVSCDVYVLHLVRDGRSTLRSIARFRSNWEAEGRRPAVRWPMLRGSVGWVVANLTASAMGAVIGRDRYLRLRYEELLQYPSSSIRRVARLLGEELSESEKRLRGGEAVTMGHLVGGSRIRFDGPVTLRRSSTSAAGGGTPARAIFTVLGGWLNRMYGYGEGKPVAERSQDSEESKEVTVASNPAVGQPDTVR